MAADNDNDTGSSGSSDTSSTSDTSGSTTTVVGKTDDEVNDIVASATGKASSKAKRELAEAQGFASVAEMESFIASAKQRDLESMDAATRAQAEAEQARAEANRERLEAKAEKLAAQVDRALLGAKIREEREGLATVYVRALLDAATEDAPLSAGDAVARLVEESPEWFESGDPLPGSDAPGSRRPATPPAPGKTTPTVSSTGGTSTQDRARAILDRQKSKRGGMKLPG